MTTKIKKPRVRLVWDENSYPDTADRMQLICTGIPDVIKILPFPGLAEVFALNVVFTSAGFDGVSVKNGQLVLSRCPVSEVGNIKKAVDAAIRKELSSGVTSTLFFSGRDDELGNMALKSGASLIEASPKQKRLAKALLAEVLKELGSSKWDQDALVLRFTKVLKGEKTDG
jgi:hypothetical protein